MSALLLPTVYTIDDPEAIDGGSAGLAIWYLQRPSHILLLNILQHKSRQSRFLSSSHSPPLHWAAARAGLWPYCAVRYCPHSSVRVVYLLTTPYHRSGLTLERRGRSYRDQNHQWMGALCVGLPVSLTILFGRRGGPANLEVRLEGLGGPIDQDQGEGGKEEGETEAEGGGEGQGKRGRTTTATGPRGPASEGQGSNAAPPPPAPRETLLPEPLPRWSVFSVILH